MKCQIILISKIFIFLMILSTCILKAQDKFIPEKDKQIMIKFIDFFQQKNFEDSSELIKLFHFDSINAHVVFSKRIQILKEFLYYTNKRLTDYGSILSDYTINWFNKSNFKFPNPYVWGDGIKEEELYIIEFKTNQSNDEHFMPIMIKNDKIAGFFPFGQKEITLYVY